MLDLITDLNPATLIRSNKMNTDTAKNENKNITAEELIETLPEEINAEQLDKVLAEEDPEFLHQMSDLSSDKSLSASEPAEEDENEAFQIEKELWQTGKSWQQKISKKFPYLVFVFFKIKRLTRRMGDHLSSLKIWIVNLAEVLKVFLKKGYKYGIAKIKTAIQSFKSLSAIQKIVLFTTIVGLVGVGYMLKLSFTKGIIPKDSPLYIQNLEDKADQVFSTTDSELESFYDNLRGAGNTIFIQKIVVNLKIIEKLNHVNPMGAFDFYIQGITPEVAVEIKDRESEIRDRMQRVAEEFSFEQLDTVSGKKELTEKLKTEINNILTTGRIKKIYIKTIILKP